MKIRQFLTVVTLFCALMSCTAVSAFAAAGALDPTFGRGGKVQTNFPNSVVPSGAALQSDGKIVIATGFDNTPAATEAFGLVRYLSNGTLDPSFGKAGITKTAFTNFLNSPNALALQNDGKIVVVGVASSADGTLSEFAVARFNSNGTLDAGFGSGGKVTTNFVGQMLGGVSNPAHAVLIQADGKILVGGAASLCAKCGTNTAIARYNTDGSLDPSFGSGGLVDIPGIGSITTLAEDEAGNIFALNGTAVAEFNSSGVLQSQITPAPIVVSSTGGASEFQPDGRYIVAQSFAETRHDFDAQLVRFQQTGGTDFTFNNPPFDFTGEGLVASDFVQSLALQSNGQIVGAGGNFTNGVNVFGVARINSDGALDASFGTSGVLTTRFSNSDVVTAVLVQADGNIIAVGQTLNSRTGLAGLALARYLGQ